MEDEQRRVNDDLAFLYQLAPFAPDADIVSRMHLDLSDLLESSRWLLEEVEKMRNLEINPDALETFLINMEVHFIEHIKYHFKTLTKDVKLILKNFPEE